MGLIFLFKERSNSPTKQNPILCYILESPKRRDSERLKKFKNRQSYTRERKIRGKQEISIFIFDKVEFKSKNSKGDKVEQFIKLTFTMKK